MGQITNNLKVIIDFGSHNHNEKIKKRIQVEKLRQRKETEMNVQMAK